MVLRPENVQFFINILRLYKSMSEVSQIYTVHEHLAPFSLLRFTGDDHTKGWSEQMKSLRNHIEAI